MILAIIIVVATVGGGITYVMLGGQNLSSETIKIGVLADLDSSGGKFFWQGALLAAEQLNAGGGIIGRAVEVVGEDHDIESGVDMVKISSALTRLISYHKVDFIIGQISNEIGFTCQDIISDHKKIFIALSANDDSLEQRVLDDYDNYKYYFTIGFNASSSFSGMSDALLFFKDNTNLRKIGFMAHDLEVWTGLVDGLDYVLSEVYGFETVYKGRLPLETFDFSSYFAAAEASEVEILIPLITGNAGIAFIKEWHDRQSPMVIASGFLALASLPECWEWTDGKCEYISTSSFPISTGYPLTSKTLPTRDTYIDRWGENPSIASGMTYDFLRFVLPDAIERAGTIETEAVIVALEETSTETSSAKNFAFTSSHGVMVGENVNDPDADYLLAMAFQWQDEELVPIYPEKIRKETGTTYKFPPWPGPWDNIS